MKIKRLNIEKFNMLHAWVDHNKSLANKLPQKELINLIDMILGNNIDIIWYSTEINYNTVTIKTDIIYPELLEVLTTFLPIEINLHIINFTTPLN